jgi:acetyl-CoA acetyltransferase
VVTLLGRMERELGQVGRRLGLATMCVGVGQGASLLIQGV